MLPLLPADGSVIHKVDFIDLTSIENRIENNYWEQIL